MNFKEFMITARTTLGVSQAEFSRMCGLHPSTISRVESGKLNMKIKDFGRVLRVLGMRVQLSPDETKPELKDKATSIIRNMNITGAKLQ